MEPFDPAMFPHRCYVQALTDGTDLTASLVESLPDVAGLTPVPCRIRLKGTVAGIVGERAVGITLADLAFPSDPKNIKGWAFRQWPNGRVFRALGPAQARDASGSLFVVSCQAIDD